MISHWKLESGVPKLAMVPGASRWEYQAPYQGVLLRQKGCWVRWAVSRQRCGLKCWRGPTTLHDSGVRFWKTRHSRTSRAVARAWGLKPCGSHIFPAPEDLVSWTDSEIGDSCQENAVVSILEWTSLSRKVLSLGGSPKPLTGTVWLLCLLGDEYLDLRPNWV